MANKRNRVTTNLSILSAADDESSRPPDVQSGEANQASQANESNESNESNQAGTKTGFFAGLGRGERLAAIVVCLLLAIGGLGATGIGGRIISTFSAPNSARKTNSSTTARVGQPAENSSTLSKLNPFAAPAPMLPSGTPQLSKEYVYAGSRMLAVEDAAASAAPPADLAVWRQSSGTWYIRNSSNGTALVAYQFGAPGDIPVRGDFDADGKTDFCVYRPGASSYWYIMTSSANQFLSVQFGTNSPPPADVPVPADYDGDGKTDVAFFRPGNLTWYILRSSDATVQSIQFGNSTDIPVPADYDGDGKADVAQYRKSSADWYWLASGSGNAFRGQQLGQAGTDDPVTGDYDGDGKYDFATWRSTSNTWNILNSSNGAATSIAWGDKTQDTAVQGDFDADGKTDIAVWRNTGASVGMWQIRNSSTGQPRTESWGTTGDIPVPAPFRR